MRGYEHVQPELTGWQVHLGAIPVAVRAAEPAWRGQDAQLLHDLAGGLAYGFDAIRAVWEQAHGVAGITGYRIRLQSVQGGLAMAVDEVTVSGHVVEATLLVGAQAFAETADADMRAAQALMGESVSEIARRGGVADESAASICQAWAQSKPTFALSIGQARTARPELASPLELDAAFSSEAHREIARRVHAAGVTAGVYAGDEAKALDRDVLAPAALRLLTERLARHDAKELISTGMIEAQRAAADREREIRNLEQSSRLVLEWDPVTRMAEVQSEHLVLRRCIEILVELALRDQPDGRTAVDRLAWMELLAAAQAYLEATSRSESVHHQVRPTAIKISDMYEIEAIDPPAGTAAPTVAGQGRVYNLDTQAFQEARASHDMGGGASAGEDYRAEYSTPDAANTTRTHLPGIPADVDEAAVQAFGVSASDIISVLFALAKWPLSDSEADAVVTDIDTVVQTLSGLLTFSSEPDGESRIRSAVGLLTSRPSDLKSADWRPWHARSRQRRLLVQPIAALRDDFAVIAPHFCLTSASVYLNYLTQGLLPWSSPPPPPELDRALMNLRDARNRQLEDDVADALRAAGYTCEVRIRKMDPQRLGVPSLSGEIDTVAGRPGSRIIWLLEVKDPADVYVVPEIRRHLDKFYATHGKDKAYVGQLSAKHKNLTPYTSAVAAALRLPAAKDLRYEIRPIFVTRRPVPAAFTGGSFPFVTLQELTRKLSADE
ncbi:MAG TPA: hypothetical protein VMU94_27650 [Streptosporangiaceae bacterium]|nr:hypothetical protein [Streptosporangiaceae bacterium]